MNWKNQVTVWATKVLKKRNSSIFLKQVAWYGAWLAAKSGTSHPVSFLLRPVAKDKRLRKVTGWIAAGLVVIAAVWGPYPLLAGENTGGEVDIIIRPEGEMSLTTKDAVALPIKAYTVSQGFWFLHPGMDMAAKMGDSVNPVMAGKVMRVEKGWLGYGNHVMVDHGGGYESLYAHLSKIGVVEGQEVNTDTELGRVGSTGHSTGPHLHLEVHQDGQAINPMGVLGIK